MYMDLQVLGMFKYREDSKVITLNNENLKTKAIKSQGCFIAKM